MDTGDDTGCGSRIVEGAFEENHIKPVITVKQQNHKFFQVKGDGSFVPAYEDEVTQDKNLSAEKPTDTTFVDDAMYFHMDVTDGYFGIGDIPWEIDNYIGKVDCNVLDSANLNGGGKQDVEHEYVDSTFGGAAADGGTLRLIPGHLDNVLGSVSPISSQPNCPSYCGSQKENLSAKCKNQSLGKCSNPVKVLDFTVPESTSDRQAIFLEDMSAPELHQAFDSAFGWDTCLNNEDWLRRCLFFGLDDFTESDSVLGLIEREFPVMENENSKVLIPGNDLAKTVHFPWMNTPEKGSPVLQSSHYAQGTEKKIVVSGGDRLKLESRRENVVCGKRTRNLPRRYIEGKSETYHKSHWRGPEVLSIINQVVVAEVPRGRRVQRVCPNKNLRFIMNDFKANNTQVLSSDSTSTSTSRSGPCDDSTYYASLDGSSDDSVEIFRKAKIRSKRKNHRQWTLDEITQLVDGVSQYGVGKWTYIKRYSFSTSSYRTSVDLKDKWRNLLRASGAQMKGSKVKPQKNMNVPIPESVLRRVKELSNIYPYPRGQKVDACDDSQSSRATS